MTRIDFYVLQDMTRDAAMRFACRLSLKGIHSGMPVHIHTNDEQDAGNLDQLMWDYPKHRFVPHSVIAGAPQADTPAAPVQIGCTEPHFNAGLLINLADDVPTFFGRFDRVAEIVVNETRDQGRDRYTHYRKRGYPLHHHDMDNWEEA